MYKASLNRSLASVLLIGLLSLTGCSKGSDTLPTVQGAKSGILALEKLTGGTTAGGKRPAALLGIFISDYLSAGRFSFVQSALLGVTAQTAFASDIGPADEDYDLLQAFADALNVDLASMLNQSVQRDEALNKYVEALDNVAARAQTRYDALKEEEKGLRDTQRTQQRDVSTAKSALSKAIKDQDFSQAGSIQQDLDEKQAALSKTQLDLTQVTGIEQTLKKLIDIYAKRALAISSNREALITGVTTVNVPGAGDLKVILPPSAAQSSKGTVAPSSGFQTPTFGG